MTCVSRLRLTGLAAGLAAVFVLSACGSNHSTAKATTTSSKNTPTTLAAVPTAVQMKVSLTDSTQTPPQVSVWTETDKIDGSYRSTAEDGSDDQAYDAVSRTLSSHLVSSGHAALNIQNNVSFAPPDQGTRQGVALAQYVRSLAAAQDPRVTPTTYLGRSAQHAQFDVSSPVFQFDHADITVDAQTGQLLLLDTTKAGKSYSRWEVTSFVVNPDLSKLAFTLSPTSKDDVNRSDDNFVDTQLSLVNSQVGYQPLVPHILPGGYSLSRVLTHAAKGETTGVDGANPQNQGVVVELYAGPGWDRLFVTTRTTGANAAAWTDPFATVAGEFGSDSVPLTVQAGAMTQATGQSVVSPAETPHVWAVGSALMATISGPFSLETLTVGLNSLN